MQNYNIFSIFIVFKIIESSNNWNAINIISNCLSNNIISKIIFIISTMITTMINNLNLLLFSN